ncbi:hypothetical protein Cgig2_001677 [Carnegiea gigantea]|uniref:Uncharacterized protein n=1 Tax=Carnegiea gigantea TaxID=171969 RepID=A0A9Q1JTI3_9CARY|nr:hypothetical protein Cgig2_001677 [Carnegiea gigantea]
MKYIGPDYSCTNKTIWSIIDRALYNVLWYDVFEYAQFCEKWAIDVRFKDTVRDKMNQSIRQCKMYQLVQILKSMKKPLQQIHQQQTLFKQKLDDVQQMLQNDPCNMELQQAEKKCRMEYLRILKSSLMLMRQQSKLDWLNYGDKGSRLKISSYVYSIRDEHDQLVYGFEVAG